MSQVEYGLQSVNFSRLHWLPICRKHVRRIIGCITRPVQLYIAKPISPQDLQHRGI